MHDKFHVSKYLNEAVDQVRRAEHKRLAAQGDSPLTGTKYQWLRSKPDKRSAEAPAFRHLYQTNLKTARAWSLKESFAPFWDYRYVKSAASYFDAWSTRAMRSRIKPTPEGSEASRTSASASCSSAASSIFIRPVFDPTEIHEEPKS